jgi:DNA repair protein REV1
MRTEPGLHHVNMSLQELKRLMALHGGGFANYYSRDTVTHIVCDHLPDTKLKQMLKSRSALPLVKAAWVVSSIAAGKLLPPSDFALDRLTMAPAQQRLAPQAALPDVQLQKADLYSQLAEADHNNSNLLHVTAGAEVVPVAPVEDQPSPKRARVVFNATDSTTIAPEAAPWEPWSLIKKPVPQSTIDEDVKWTAKQIEAALRTAASMRAATDVLKGPPKSSADDPGFMDTFFKASRLHFIGTWKMRIEELLRDDAKKLSLQSRPLSPARASTSKRCQSERCVVCSFVRTHSFHQQLASSVVYACLFMRV